MDIWEEHVDVQTVSSFVHVIPIKIYVVILESATEHHASVGNQYVNGSISTGIHVCMRVLKLVSAINVCIYRIPQCHLVRRKKTSRTPVISKKQNVRRPNKGKCDSI